MLLQRSWYDHLSILEWCYTKNIWKTTIACLRLILVRLLYIIQSFDIIVFIRLICYLEFNLSVFSIRKLILYFSLFKILCQRSLIHMFLLFPKHVQYSNTIVIRDLLQKDHLPENPFKYLSCSLRYLESENKLWKSKMTDIELLSKFRKKVYPLDA